MIEPNSRFFWLGSIGYNITNRGRNNNNSSSNNSSMY